MSYYKVEERKKLRKQIKIEDFETVKDLPLLTGTRQINELIFVGLSTKIPTIRRRLAHLFQLQPLTNVDPDEAVALGAAMQAGVLGGDVKDVLLLDVTPHALGVQVAGSAFLPMIEANTTIPTRSTKKFSTHEAGQSKVTIHVVERENSLFGEIRLLGSLRLEGLKSKGGSKPVIKLTFDIDANSMLAVNAKDLGSNEEANMKFSPL